MSGLAAGKVNGKHSAGLNFYCFAGYLIFAGFKHIKELCVFIGFIFSDICEHFYILIGICHCVSVFVKKNSAKSERFSAVNLINNEFSG